MKNIEKHGISFRDAILVFEGVFVEIDSPYPFEMRTIAIGLVDDLEVSVIYTVRKGKRRIISARRARLNERQILHRKLEGISDEAGKYD